VNKQFYISSMQHLLVPEFQRTLRNAGVSQAHVDVLRQPGLWTSDQRVAVRQTLDAVIYACTDMAGLPRVDIPAEYVAAVVATLVSPVNFLVLASWVADHKPARDLAQAEENVQIQRVHAGKMASLIIMAHAAIHGDEGESVIASKIRNGFSVQKEKG